jgi:hypothetical protein
MRNWISSESNYGEIALKKLVKTGVRPRFSHFAVNKVQAALRQLTTHNEPE